MSRTDRLVIHVSSDEKARITARGHALGFSQFGLYARALLPDPFGAFTKSRLLEIMRELYTIEQASRQGDPTVSERLGVLNAQLRTWIEPPDANR